ncbi:MAG: divergent polysaccharide deacetylase family protein, partial [Spirochaetaceae bacterium]|nr:divergent polysaccharide deacetylase family protein [Spirochaetaceae bacterium]
GTLYLILDDAGNNLQPLPAFLEFPGPLAVAVLPQLPYSVESAARTAAAGKEIMLHLPMEAVGGANPGPGALTTGMSDRDILRVIDENLGSVPGVIGVNNHMGSLATSDRRIMEIVLADLQRRDLFFIDSRTTVETVAKPVAGYLQTPFAERHVFLDNERSRDAILTAVRGALELAHRQDQVVMIGHATVPELAAVLNEIYPILTAHGYRFGLVSELVEVLDPSDGEG